MYARVSHYEPEEGSREDVVRAFEEARTALAAMEGTSGGFLLVSPEADEAITITLWANEDAARASTAAADATRDRAMAASGWHVRSVDLYEVALDFGCG